MGESPSLMVAEDENMDDEEDEGGAAAAAATAEVGSGVEANEDEF